MSFHVHNISNLQLTSFNRAVSIHSASIHCTSLGNFHFKHTLNVTIVDLLFFIEPMARILSGTLTFDNAINFRIHQVIVEKRL